METPSSPSPALRTIAILLLAVFAAGGAWFAFRGPGASTEPAGVWEYIRDRVLAGDGEAPWRMLLPEARPKFLEFVKENADAPESDARAAEWRRKVGLSRQDLRTLPPEKVMAKEYLANADRIRGSRVFRTEMWPGERALISISLSDGKDIRFVLKRRDGAWRIADLLPMITSEGYYTPEPGAAAEKVPVAK